MAVIIRHHKVVLSIGCVVTSLTIASLGLANPTNPTVAAGQAQISGLGTSAVTIHQATQQAVINWQQFNIAPNEVTRFIQPNVSAVALNRIFDQNPSQILGSLQANGNVILLNPNGILFGPNAQVNVGGLIASSLNLTNANFLSGNYLFQGTGAEGWVKNAGSIQGATGVYLLAPNVENSGIITSPGGNIVLGAGATAYLSNRPDGHGFLAEITAPTGQAVNLKDLIADGGDITVAGRVVNQQGLIQANSVRQQNGKIELYASESITFAAGSKTLAKGDQQGISDGGTIIAQAGKTSGTTSLNQGAAIDVSGGPQGGNAGYVDLSGAQVSMLGTISGRAAPGFRGGTLLIDPTNLTVDDNYFVTQLSPQVQSGMTNIIAQATNNLTVTANQDLLYTLGWVLQPGQRGTLTFQAGQNLTFQNASISNDAFSTGQGSPWDFVGIAGNNINMINSTLVAGAGGNISLTATAGSLSLIDPVTGALSSIRTKAGGNITLNAGLDLIASTGYMQDATVANQFLFKTFTFLDSYIQGILLDGPGTLSITAGRNFIGALANGVQTGPGFVVRNGQAVVTVGGDVGQTLPGTTAGFADMALSNGSISMTAAGNIYLRRVQDAGLVCGSANSCDTDPSNPGTFLGPQFLAGAEHSSVSFTAQNGNIVIDTTASDAVGTPVIPQLSPFRGVLPASFTAKALNGSIDIDSNLTFFPSPTGSLNFFAQNNIVGVSPQHLVNNPSYEWLFVGYGGPLGGQWEAINTTTIMQNPQLWPFLSNVPFSSTLPLSANQAPQGGPTAPMTGFPGAQILVNNNVQTIKFLQADPQQLEGNSNLASLSSLFGQSPSFATTPTGMVAPVSFQAVTGDITNLGFNLVSPSFLKQVTIEAGHDITQFQASISLPNLGTQTVPVVEQIPFVRDPTTGLLVIPANGATVNAQDVTVETVTVQVPVPNVAAIIKAGNDIVLGSPNNTALPGPVGIQFYGSGTGQIIAGHDLNLGISQGINMLRATADKGGLLDVAVGNNLLMAQSQIHTDDGAGVSIHGLVGPSYVLGYDNSALHPSSVPSSLQSPVNAPPPLGGTLNVGVSGGTSAADIGKDTTGIEVQQGGSVGVKATTAVVNADGTVTVSVARDPTAISIRTTGDIDVNQARVDTLNGGNIVMTSTQGNINAGSGGANNVTNVLLQVPVLDSAGNPVFDSSGNPVTKTTPIAVPGSGIFTFSPSDPNPLIFPVFNDPQINALKAEAEKLQFFGRDASALLAQINQLTIQKEQIFNETVKTPFINSLKLGDITLNAEQGRIIIPPAGIRGRIVTLNSPFLDFQGGTISGNVQVPPSAAISGNVSISGTVTGSSAAQSATVSSFSGSSAVASVSATSAAVSTSAKSSDSAKESVDESSSQQAAAKQVASKKNDEKDGKSQLAKSVRVKRGVVIQVDVKPEVKQGS